MLYGQASWGLPGHMPLQNQKLAAGQQTAGLPVAKPPHPAQASAIFQINHPHHGFNGKMDLGTAYI